MSEDTLDIPVRAKRVRKISGALAAIPTTAPNAAPLLQDVERLTDRTFRQLSETRKLDLLRALRHQLIDQQQRYSSLLKISSSLGATLDPVDFLEMTMEHIPDVMRAERATLYLIDRQTGALHGTIAQGAETEIVLRPGQGIAGWVAETSQSLNIRDAYDDPRFHSDFDDETGFETRSMLCQPLRNSEGENIAVVQVLNSHSDHFSEEDENLLSAIGGQIAIALENSDLYHSVVDKNEQLQQTTTKLQQKVAELDLLYDIQSDLSQPSDLSSLVKTITQKTLELVNGKACSLTLCEPSLHRVYVMIDRCPTYSRNWDYYTRTVSPDQTVASRVIESGEPFVCSADACQQVPGPTPYESGLEAKNIIAVPLFDDDSCIGALQVFNLALPQDPTRLGFTEDDVKILTLIASQIASTVASRRRRELREKEDRLATIGQMIAGILHDFKTPFSVISGYVQLMADADDRKQRHQYADRVLQQFRDLNQMTRELLKFARGDSRILLRKIFIHVFVDELTELLESEFDSHNIDFELDLQYRGEVHLDPVKMKRAIVNLARNATDAMDDGGRFRMRVERVDELLRLTFEDTGKGIPAEIQDHLFESFVTRGKEDGTGLGLAVVKKIVDEHRGSITFDTEPGEGTTFVIELPIAPPDDSP